MLLFVSAVKVPLDAYMMDFVFSEREDGGIFDNKNGMDYHIPVVGGINKEPPLHIVHIAVEMAPIAKVNFWFRVDSSFIVFFFIEKNERHIIQKAQQKEIKQDNGESQCKIEVLNNNYDLLYYFFL